MSQAFAQHDYHNEGDPSAKQAEASNPLRSVWVGASAGTGKTKVLIDRVLRLMLPRESMGEESATLPSRVLCLTFTKTAAAEMSSRIYERLSEWSVKTDEEIKKDLLSVIGSEPSEQILAATRKLFAKVLDAPGGIKIMTIHSFCQYVLKAFPVEAGLPPHFKLVDEKDAREYLTQCLNNIIRETQNNSDSTLAKSFNFLTLHLDAKAMSELMQQIISKRSLLTQIFKYNKDKTGSAENTIKKIYKVLKIKEGLIEADIIKRLFDETNKNIFSRIIEELHTKKKSDEEKSQKIEAWIKGDLNFNSYKTVFLTTEDKIRAKHATKVAIENFPEILEIMQAEAEKILDIIDKVKSLKLAELNASLLTVVASILGRYKEYKSNRDSLDYDDLIIKTGELLSQENMAPWVLYKLDNGIDHILVDEAQDTSPNQWKIVKALSEEFFAGKGSKENIKRTLFVVGDEKQSIFGFQGADPAEFANMQKFFGEKVAREQDSWEIFLNHSFRSTSAVLEIVDRVFSVETSRKGVVSNISHEIKHLAHRKGQAGMVELWPVIKNYKKESSEPWQMPTTIETVDNSSSLLANKIASTIKSWLDNNEILKSKDRPIRAGDILILVQSRGVFVELLMRSLKTANVPVAGVDRINLLDEIAIIDILALAQFALLPKDSLTLANVLKSPLVAISEDELYNICYDRGDRPLWLSLRSKNKEIAESLQHWVRIAGKATPYEFFAEVLNRPCFADKISGRRAFYSRLGYNIQDAIDEFLNLCLHYEQSHIPSLQKFIDWFLRGTTDIKREQQSGDENLVRIMTVHASKGLQAPILFLPDTIKQLHTNNKGKIRLLWSKDESGIPLWSSRKEFDSIIYTEKQNKKTEKQDEEYRRLLYVALTRAEDRLYICGYRGVNKEKENCWYNLVSSVFPKNAKKIDFDIEGKKILDEEENSLPALRFEYQQEALPKKEEDKKTIPAKDDVLPIWCREKPQEEPVPPKPLVPSKPDEDEPAVKPPLADIHNWKFNRGNIIHKLLELLPELPKNKWDNALEKYLARNILEMPKEAQKDLAKEILEVLNHSDFADIFVEGSIAEVPLVGLMGNNILSGKIDRLVVKDNEVLIIDYKSNRNPPETSADIPKIYLKQMALYAASIKKIYPNYKVSCALLWTEAPILMPIENSILDSYSV